MRSSEVFSTFPEQSRTTECRSAGKSLERVKIHCCDRGFDSLAGLFTLVTGTCVLQRLYSTFARGWPGIGLFCLRLVSAIAVFTVDGAQFTSAPSLLRTVIPGAAALLLFAGLWTPIAGGALAIFEVWAAFSGKGNFWAEILLAVISAALAMLGPGAWSIDARLFGRKRLIPPS